MATTITILKQTTKTTVTIDKPLTSTLRYFAFSIIKIEIITVSVYYESLAITGAVASINSEGLITITIRIETAITTTAITSIVVV